MVKIGWKLHICGSFGCIFGNIQADSSKEARGQSQPRRPLDHHVKIILIKKIKNNPYHSHYCLNKFKSSTNHLQNCCIQGNSICTIIEREIERQRRYGAIKTYCTQYDHWLYLNSDYSHDLQETYSNHQIISLTRIKINHNITANHPHELLLDLPQ